MSRKFVEKEGPRWVKEGIVNGEQVQQILALYENRSRVIGLLPILGGILLSLGILTFVASNWQEIAYIWRLVILIGLMIGLYVAGEIFQRKGMEKFGIAFTGLGLISFGASIILIAQMFNMEAYNITSWIIWGIVGILLTWLYQSRYLYLISLLILTIAQIFSQASFQHFSEVGAVVLIAGLGSYLWVKKDLLLASAFAISYLVHAIILTTSNSWEFYWVFVLLLLLYTLGDALRDSRLILPFQFIPVAALYIFQLVIVGAGDDGMESEIFANWSDQYSYFIVLLVILAVSLYLKFRANRLPSAIDWILAPFIVFLPKYMDVTSMLLLFVFSLLILWMGYMERWDLKINLGTILFLIATMTAYSKITWDFMDRSLFFVVGGMLLLGLSWFLNRRRKSYITQDKGDVANE
jgi:uncharacterized membrane protein